MTDKPTIPPFAIAGKISSGLSVAATLLASWPAHAQGALSVAPQLRYGWVAAWCLALLAVIFFGYIRQNRMIRMKTAELRRELFERQMAEKELLASDRMLRQSLAEKEALLKEIHHRVKNNLQVVSSLLYLQEDYLQDPKGVEILRESQNRVKSMALIHEQLYGTADLAKIDFGRYILSLAANLFDAYGIDPARLRIDIQADDVALGVDMAVPCGLIVNELVSNAIKHAFPADRGGTINILIRKLGDGRMEIVVADDGIGLVPPTANSMPQSLGLRLIDTLTAQLDGSMRLKTEKGTRFSIILNIPEPRTKEQ